MFNTILLIKQSSLFCSERYTSEMGFIFSIYFQLKVPQECAIVVICHRYCDVYVILLSRSRASCVWHYLSCLCACLSGCVGVCLGGWIGCRNFNNFIKRRCGTLPAFVIEWESPFPAPPTRAFDLFPHQLVVFARCFELFIYTCSKGNRCLGCRVPYSHLHIRLVGFTSLHSPSRKGRKWPKRWGPGWHCPCTSALPWAIQRCPIRWWSPLWRCIHWAGSSWPSESPLRLRLRLHLHRRWST